MKNNIQIICFACSIFILQACTEIGPAIDFTPVDTSLTDTTYVQPLIETPQQRVVLFEDFTGVQCVNCPTAHDKTTELQNLYPDRIIVIAEHNYFAGPYPESIEDYVIPEANELNAYLGPAFGWPAGVIDRYDFAGTGNLTTLLISNYQIFVEDRLDEPTLCNLYMAKEYDADSRQLNVTVKVVYTGTVTDENHLSIMLLEDHIIDLQETLSGINYDYEHNHVLRDMMTPTTGVILNAELIPGRVFEKEFSMALPDNWNDTNVSVVNFVNTFTVCNKVVLQSSSINVVD